jgi:hypothetical protein
MEYFQNAGASNFFSISDIKLIIRRLKISEGLSDVETNIIISMAARNILSTRSIVHGGPSPSRSVRYRRPSPSRSVQYGVPSPSRGIVHGALVDFFNMYDQNPNPIIHTNKFTKLAFKEQDPGSTTGTKGGYRQGIPLYIMYLIQDRGNLIALQKRRNYLFKQNFSIFEIVQTNPHITLFDLTFNPLFNDYIGKFADLVNNNLKELIGMKIRHERDNYKLMGSFWGKLYELTDHSKIQLFRNKIISEFQQYLLENKGINLGIIGLYKNSNEKKFYCFGNLKSDVTKYRTNEHYIVSETIFLVPEYHTGNKWQGHISVVDLRNNSNALHSEYQLLTYKESSRKLIILFDEIQKHLPSKNEGEITRLLNAQINKQYSKEKPEEQSRCIAYHGRKRECIENKCFYDDSSQKCDAHKIPTWKDIVISREDAVLVQDIGKTFTEKFNI